jgi:hemoglobin
MELKITPHTYGERIEPFLPDNKIFEELGEKGIRKMISEFYDLLIMSKIKYMFPTDEEEFKLAKQHAADFIIQRFGGPDFYNQRRGKPLLVKRHNPFKITPEARIVWLECYREAILNQPLSEQTTQEYWRFIDEFSTWMVNTPGESNDLKGFKISV